MVDFCDGKYRKTVRCCTVTAWFDCDKLKLHDTYNSFECSVNNKHIDDFLDVLNSLKDIQNKEVQSELYVLEKYPNSNWYRGNFVILSRVRIYIDVINEMCKPTNYKSCNLKRMATINLLDIYSNVYAQSVIFKNKKARSK